VARSPLRHRRKTDRFRQGSGSRRAELANELLEFVASEADELGTHREMAHIERIMREGTGADRQLAAFERTHDMKAVVDHIVAETYEGLDVSRQAEIVG